MMGGLMGSILIATDADGASGWAEIVHSARRALADNQALAPILGLMLLVTVVIVLDWKLAGWIMRAWRRGRASPRSKPARAPARR